MRDLSCVLHRSRAGLAQRIRGGRTRTTTLGIGLTLALLASVVAVSAQALGGPGSATCHYGSTRREADVRTKSIPEASALVASGQWPGAYWTVNDSHNQPTLHAFDQQGQDRGTFRVENAKNVDWEALQLGPGRDGGWALYVGDIGDNDAKRRDVVIYRVAEPAPLAADAASATQTVPSEAFTFVYPDSAHDAEAMLVHPETGEILVITKEARGHSTVYRVPLPLDRDQTMTLERVAALDVSAVGSKGNEVTDASISPDGQRVTVRTYSRALELDVPAGSPLASIWTQAPRVVPLDDGPHGEGITYERDGAALMTIGEDKSAALFRTPLEC